MSETLPPRDDADEREARFQEQAERDLPRNYLAHLAHGMLGQTGFRLIQVPTFIPVYVELISGSPIAVGAARAFQSFGMFLSPILGATIIEHRRRVLPMGFWIGGLMRVQVLGLALAGFFLSGLPELVAVFGFLALFGFFMGMQGVIFSTLVSKVIPVERRGRLMGLRNALAGLTAGAVGGLGGWLVETNALGNGYATTFLLAFALTALGLSMLAFIREPESPSVRVASDFRSRLSELPALLRSDPGFTRYFLARALATMGRMSVPFYVLYADPGPALLGPLTIAFILSWSMGNLAWGEIADRIGFRAVFIASLLLWVVAALALMYAGHEAIVLVLIMVGLGAGFGGFQMSSQNLVLEFGSRENLPMRIAVANAASELVGAIGPLVGGVLAVMVSYESVFWTGIAFQLAAVGWVLRAVPEPRKRG
ncbi:MAG: MFS transporter [Deltaproteobacteria bacterium]|nr:MFS transporter [Deltaproteobacteria bacterium]MBW2395357.1 MFS transporter [Deltaproteobacteria bacterium]